MSHDKNPYREIAKKGKKCCLRCHRMFISQDVKRNRICGECSPVIRNKYSWEIKQSYKRNGVVVPCD
jgi:hypothetical protein